MAWTHPRKWSPRALLLGACLATAPYASGVDFSTVVLTGEDAPGVAPNPAVPHIDPEAVFSRFNSRPVINAAGQVSFAAQVDGLFLTSDLSHEVWTNASGAITPIVVSNDTVAYPSGASAPTTTATVFHKPVFIDSNGETVVEINVEPLELNNFLSHSGLWRTNQGALDPLLIDRQLIPDDNGTTTLNGSTNTFFAFNPTGDFVFATRASDVGVWADYGSGPELAAFDGEFIVQDPVQRRYVMLSAQNHKPRITPNGTIAFVAELTGDLRWSDAVIMGTPGSMSIYAKVYNPAPDATGDEFLEDPFNGIYDVGINNSGEVIFTGSTGISPHIIGTNGIWSSGGGKLRQILQEDALAPDAGPGVRFAGFNTPVINAHGDIAFRAVLEGEGVDSSNQYSFWRKDVAGGFEMVAREGDAAPGTEDGTVFESLFINDIWLNAAGNLVFQANLAGDNIDLGTGGNNVGIWATDANGDLKLIVRRGDLFDVNDDPLVEDLRTIEAILFEFSESSGGEDGRFHSLNEAGQLALGLRFTDGSEGIFIADLNAVPEPSSIAALGLAGVLLLRRRR